MKKIMMIFSLLFSSPTLFAQKSFPKPYIIYKGLKIHCPKNLKDECLVKKIIDEKKMTQDEDKQKYPSGGVNPTTIACDKFKGENGLLKDDRGSEYPICRFEDKSYVSGWDLVFYLTGNAAPSKAL